MTITAIDPNATYQLSGADFLAAIANAVKSTIAELGVSQQPVKEVKHKYTTEEAAKYLGIEVATLHQWKNRYSISYEKGRPNYYSLSELQRVEKERNVRPM